MLFTEFDEHRRPLLRQARRPRAVAWDTPPSTGHTIEYRGVDAAGNVAPAQSVAVLDLIAPVTTASPPPPVGGWYPLAALRSPPPTRTRATSTMYALDGGAFTRTGPVSGFTPRVALGAVLRPTRREWPRRRRRSRCGLDATALATRLASAASPNGANGWYVTPTVTLSATDAGSVWRRRYIVDGGASQTYSGPFVPDRFGARRHVPLEGQRRQHRGGEDDHGQGRPDEPDLVGVDLAGHSTAGTSPTVTLTGADGAGSGIQFIKYALDVCPWTTQVGLVSASPPATTSSSSRRPTTPAGPSVNPIAFKADATKPK